MKKLIFILCFVVIGCSSSDDDQQQPQQITGLLIGKWTPEIETNYASNGNVIVEFDYSEEPCYQMTTFEYKSNGQMVEVSFDFFGGNCVANPVNNYNYTLSGNNITFSSGGVQQIVENTNLVLKLKTVDPDGSYEIIQYSKVN